MSSQSYCVYILSSRSGTLYVGITNDLIRRVTEHKEQKVPGFTQRYNVTELVYYEEFTSVKEAIDREKQIKGWSRAKKVAIILEFNGDWRDLSNDW